MQRRGFLSLFGAAVGAAAGIAFETTNVEARATGGVPRGMEELFVWGQCHPPRGRQARDPQYENAEMTTPSYRALSPRGTLVEGVLLAFRPIDGSVSVYLNGVLLLRSEGLKRRAFMRDAGEGVEVDDGDYDVFEDRGDHIAVLRGGFLRDDDRLVVRYQTWEDRA